jgi:hypothetical protein
MLCFSFIQSLCLFSLGYRRPSFVFFLLSSIDFLYTKVGCDDGRIRKQERPVYCVFLCRWAGLSSSCLRLVDWNFFGNAQSPKIAGSAKGKWLSFRDWFLAMDARMFVNDVQYTSDVRVNVYIPGKRKLKLCQSWKTKSESDCADTISRSRVWSSQFSSRPMTYCVCVGPGTKDALLRGRSGMADGRCSR